MTSNDVGYLIEIQCYIADAISVLYQWELENTKAAPNERIEMERALKVALRYGNIAADKL